MAYDISTELNTIANNERGEDVRDAIVSAFRKMTTNVTGAIKLTEAEWEELSEDERNNGAVYFVSDVDVIEGNEYRLYDLNSDDGVKLLIDYSVALGIVEKVKSMTGIPSNISLSEVTSLLNSYSLVKSIFETRIGSLNSPTHINSANGSWMYSADDNVGPYVIDVYEVKANNTYVVMLDAVVSNQYLLSFYVSDPTLYRENYTGTRIAYLSGNNVVPWLTRSYTPSQDGYLAIQMSNNATLVRSYMINATKLATLGQSI